MARKRAPTSGTSHLLKDLNLSPEHQGIVDLVHNANKSLREGKVPAESVKEVQNLVKEHVVHLHKVLPKDTVSTIFTRLAPPAGEANALRDAVNNPPKGGVPFVRNLGEHASKAEEKAARRPENLGDIIDKNAARLAADKDHTPAVYPPKVDIEEPPVTTPKTDKPASWKQGTPEEVAAKRRALFGGGEEAAFEFDKPPSVSPAASDKAAKRAAAKAHNEAAAALRAADKPPAPSVDLHTDITTKADLAAKAKEQTAKDKSLAAQLKKATAANKRLRKAAETKVEPPPPAAAPPAAPPEAATGELRLSFDDPPPPPAPAPVTEKAVVAEPPVAKVEPAAIAKAAKAPSKAGVELAGVEKLNKSNATPRVSPVGKKIHNIFEELKTSVEGRKDTPKAAGSRAAIFEAGQNLEKRNEKPPTTKSIFKELKPGKGDPLAKLAVSVEGENLKQASRADTTPDVESPRAKLRMEMDEAGKAMKRFDPVKKYTPPVKLTRPPLELPEAKPSTPFGLANKPWSGTHHPAAAAAEATPEWLGVARKAATAAEEGSTVSKAAKVGEFAGKTAGKLGKLGIAGLAIYGGIEALKKIGEKLKE